jgi:hypothetical protein
MVCLSGVSGKVAFFIKVDWIEGVSLLSDPCLDSDESLGENLNGVSLLSDPFLY